MKKINGVKKGIFLDKRMFRSFFILAPLLDLMCLIYPRRGPKSLGWLELFDTGKCQNERA